jgi:hypothetical protein
MLLSPTAEIFRAMSWELIWTPPYCSYWCWIELYWLSGKSFVGAPSQQEVNRRLSTVVQQLRHKWYGSEDVIEDNVYGSNTDGHRDKCINYMDEWINEDTMLTGTMRDPARPLMVVVEGGEAVEVTAEVMEQWARLANMKTADERAAVEMAEDMGGDLEDPEEEGEGEDEDEDEGSVGEGGGGEMDEGA